MSNTNPLIRSHQFNYSPFTEISIIGDIIGDNRSFIGDTIGDIGVTFGGIYYDIRLFISDIGAIFYDISVLNNNFECGVIAKQELSRIAFVFVCILRAKVIPPHIRDLSMFIDELAKYSR